LRNASDSLSAQEAKQSPSTCLRKRTSLKGSFLRTSSAHASGVPNAMRQKHIEYEQIPTLTEIDISLILAKAIYRKAILIFMAKGDRE
jgi:hypothetical protein